MVEPFEVFVQPLVSGTNERAQRRAGEVAVLVVDRLDAGSVDRQQLAAVKVEPPAQQHELAEHRCEGAAIVASEVRDRLEVRLEAAHQPDDLDIALGFPLQPSARSNPVQIAVDVELQEIAGRITRPPRRLRFDSREAGARKIEPINEGLDEPNQDFCTALRRQWDQRFIRYGNQVQKCPGSPQFRRHCRDPKCPLESFPAIPAPAMFRSGAENQSI